MESETGQIARMEATADKHIRYGFMASEAKELLSLTIEIDHVGHEFDQLYLRALAELPSWPRKQYEQSQGIHYHRTGLGTFSIMRDPPPPSFPG
jgi:hypothetical protein